MPASGKIPERSSSSISRRNLTREFRSGHIMTAAFKAGVLATLLGATNTVFAGCPFLSGNEVRHVVQIGTNDDEFPTY